MRHSIKLDCKTHHISKDGTFPILLRVTLNGEQDYFNIGKRIYLKHYDEKNKVVRSGIKGAGGYNDIINLHQGRIGKIIDDFDKKGEIVSIARVKEMYNKESGVGTSKCFYDFVRNRIDWEKKHTKIKTDTFKFIEVNFDKLKKYRKKLSIHDINETFIDEYKSHITKTLGQKDNTAYHAICFLRKYTKRLYKENKISTYPFQNYEVGSPFQSELVYLEPEELQHLHDLYDSKKLLSIVKVKKSKYAKDFNIGVKLQEVLRYFLLSCYTGFRHSDMKTLMRHHIVGDEIVKKIVKAREGREKTVRIPIRNNFFSLLDMSNPQSLLFENPVMEDAQTNKYLKLIMDEAKIKKHITFHKSRYTFGIISLILGVDIVVVSDVLGHSELTTTQRYAKVVDRLKKQEMSKWDNFRQPKLAPDNSIEILCSNCDTLLFKFEKGLFSQKNIKCTCPNCSITNIYDLTTNEVESTYNANEPLLL